MGRLRIVEYPVETPRGTLALRSVSSDETLHSTYTISHPIPAVDAEAELTAHIAAVGLETVEDYRAWCLKHGFSDLLCKSRRQQQREVRVATWLKQVEATETPAVSRDAIQQIFDGAVGDTVLESTVLETIHHGFRMLDRDEKGRDALRQLLLHVSDHPDLLSMTVAIPRMGPQTGNTFLEGLIALAHHHRAWRRPIAEWAPDAEEDRTRLKFGSLVRHLLAQFGVPAFMDTAWFKGHTREAQRQQEWFIHIGTGLSLFDTTRPPPLTKRMAHYFLQTPPPYLIEEAIRWGYILGLGGKPHLARAVIDSPLGMTMKHEPFWRHVLLFLIRHPDLDLACVEPVIDYIHHQRFVSQEITQADGTVERRLPPQPRLTMTHRSLEKLLRETAARHRRLPAGDRRTGAMVRWRLHEEAARWRQRRAQPVLSLPPADPIVHLTETGQDTAETYRAWCREHGFRDTLHKTWREQQQEQETAIRDRNEAAFTAEVMHHIESLGLHTIEAYQDWCRCHAFSDILRKSRRQRRREVKLAEWLRSRTALTAARRQTRRPMDTITGIYKGTISAGDLKVAYLQRVAAGFAALEDDPESRDAFLQLLHTAASCADLFDLHPAIPRLGPQPGNTYIDGLAALARHHRDWIRPVDAWKPESHNARRQFGALARHLFAKYDIPAFMDVAWFRSDPKMAQPQQGWFKHIGIGRNIRTADIPLHLTKMMAHHFLEAPDHYFIEEAFRRGQILGQNGSRQLVEAILTTPLGTSFEHEAFWGTVIQFLVNSPMLDPTYSGPIIDYIHHQKYVPQEIVHPGGEVEYGPPPHPDYQMKGRGRLKLLRQVEAWLQHREAMEAPAPWLRRQENMAGKTQTRARSWKPSGIGSFTYEEEDPRTEKTVQWTIRELLSTRELVVEGREMHHCVASYSRRCQRGAISVWSLQVQHGKGRPVRIMTLSLQNRRRIIMQARGKYNAHPLGEAAGETRWKNLKKNEAVYLQQAPKIVGMWMTQEGLR